ncbi:MAG: glycosyltransferase family 4 protein [Crocinitomicaceae bacterium]
MRILFLTQYYPPEVGAPQNRLHELALRLKSKGAEVEVLTAMPNYPKMEIEESYRGGKIKEEYIDGIKVYRSGIFVSKSSSIIHRLLNYFSFVFTSYFKGRKLVNYDFLLVESPPLFLGYSAMGLAKKLKAKLIFNVSDLWPESAEKLDLVSNKYLLKLAYDLEKRCYKKAKLVTGQTQGIVDDIKGRFPSKDVFWLPNGVDLEYYNPNQIKSDFRLKNGFEASDLLFFYGGIIGHAQGLEVILEAANQLKDYPNIKFIVQGAGPEKERLLVLKEKLKLDNVFFFNAVNKNEMPSILKGVDVALVPLKKLELFTGAIPSKIFEALAMEKALLLGVDGEAKKHFIDKADSGYFFEPENVKDLVDKIIKLEQNPEELKRKGQNGRAYVNEYFNRNNIATSFYEKLKNV